jgi:hypothetical protein
MAQTQSSVPFFIRIIVDSRLSIHMRLFPRILLLTLLTIPQANGLENQESVEVTAQGSLLDFNYREYSDQGSLLDEENGILPGLIFGLGKNQGKWRFAGKLSCHAGDATYTGKTNHGVPISTVTTQLITDLGFRLDYTLKNEASIVQGIYLGAAQHYWKRNIHSGYTATGAPVSGLLEKYRWRQWIIGANAEILSRERSRWLLDVRLMRIANPQVTVFYSGLYDDAHLALGAHWGARVSLPWLYSLGQSSALLVEPYAERYIFGRSATAPLTSHGIPVGGVFEPESVTKNFGLSVGVKGSI